MSAAIPAIPLADAPAFAGLARRSALVRLALAGAIAATALAAVVAARGLHVGEGSFFAPGSAGTVVLDLSSSTEAAPPEQIELALRRIARSGRRAGLILFSDVAYEALPPTAKASELTPFIRYFHAPREAARFGPGFTPSTAFGRVHRARNPWLTFRGGTRISTGLRLAMDAEQRSSRRGVVLISDLNDSLFDLPQLTRVLRDYKRAGLRLRIVALNPTPDDRAFWTRQAGQDAFVPDTTLRKAASPRAIRLVASFPRALVVLGVVLAVLLAASELWSARLRWSVA